MHQSCRFALLWLLAPGRRRYAFRPGSVVSILLFLFSSVGRVDVDVAQHEVNFEWQLVTK